MTEIPEHLLRRAREHRERLEDTRSNERSRHDDIRRLGSASLLRNMLEHERTYVEDVAAQEIQYPERTESAVFDPTDIGAIIGVSVAESCSLDALKIRANVAKKLTGKDESAVNTRIQSEDIVDISFELGERRVQGSEYDRQVISLGFQDGIGLYAWVDNPKDGMFGRDRRHKGGSIDEEPIYFGFATQTRYDRQLFVPIIKSSVANGCQFVIPEGSEADDIAFNQTEVLSTLARIVEQNAALDPDKREIVDLLNIISTVLTTSSEGAQLQLFIEQQLRKLPEEYRVVEALFSGELDSIQRTTRNLLPYDETNRRRFDVVGNTFETDHLVEGDTHQLEYFLEDAGLSTTDNELPAKEFILWNGLDPDVYPGADQMFPRFSLKQSEFGVIEITFYENGDFVSGREPTEEETKFLLHVLNKKLTTQRKRELTIDDLFSRRTRPRLRNRASERLNPMRARSRRSPLSGILYPPDKIWNNPH